MLKRRLIGVVTVKSGRAVQSFGFDRYLPLGKPECLVENLGRWGADEILVQVIDRSAARVGPDFELLERLGRVGSGTPLIYGGGIRTIEDGVEVIQRGADRICVDALLHDDLPTVRGLSERLGAQAVIASMPMARGTAGLEWLNYRAKTAGSVTAALAEILENRVISEVLLTDWKHEGTPNSFDTALVDLFPHKAVPLIVFGGISNSAQMREILGRTNVAAISVGNFLSYREHAIQQLRAQLGLAALRPSNYATGYSLLANA